MSMNDKIKEASEKIKSLINDTNINIILMIEETIEESLGEDYEIEVYTNEDLVINNNPVIDINLKTDKEFFSYEIHAATEDIESAVDLIIERHIIGNNNG